MPSTIPAARDAIWGLLVANQGAGLPFEGVQLAYGAPVFHTEDDVVALVGFRPTQHEASTVGTDAPRFREQYTVDVGVQAHTGGTSSQSAKRVDDRASELAEAVRQIVLDNGTLGGTVDWALPGNWESVGAIYTSEGWLCQINVEVAISASPA